MGRDRGGDPQIEQAESRRALVVRCCFLPRGFVALANVFHSPALRLVGTQISRAVEACKRSWPASPVTGSTNTSISAAPAASIRAALHASRERPARSVRYQSHPRRASGPPHRSFRHLIRIVGQMIFEITDQICFGVEAGADDEQDALGLPPSEGVGDVIKVRDVQNGLWAFTAGQRELLDTHDESLVLRDEEAGR